MTKKEERKIIIDEKEYKESDLSDKVKVLLEHLALITTKKQGLIREVNILDAASNMYSSQLRMQLSADSNKEEETDKKEENTQEG